ncbi:MAG: GNAT family N-acetyltransferase, partial [Proteobacteria bacterium]|nr:GNAT family N-acetyltransferase [Pseudomonadota bacterium]
STAAAYSSIPLPTQNPDEPKFLYADLGDFGRTEPVAVIDTLDVAPEYSHHGIGHALLQQLFLNLGALRIERVETVVDRQAFPLLGFFYGMGFAPSQRLAFVKRVGK